MKKIQFFAMALAALTIISCSKETPGNGGAPTIVEGVETYATFTFSVEKSSAPRSETDKGSTANQDKVNNITVAIFKDDLTAKLEAHGTFKATAGATIMTGEPMKVTSGSKRIFVFANAEGLSGFPDLTDGTTLLSDCYTTVMEPMNADVSAFSLANLTKTDGYYMSNARTASSVKVLLPNISLDDSKAAGITDAADRAKVNNFSFGIQKAVSKVHARLASADVLKIGETTSAGTASISEMQFTVKNINKGVRPVQLFNNPNISDAEAFTQQMLPEAPYYTDFRTTSATDLLKPSTFAGKYSNLNPIDQTLGFAAILADAEAVLVTENTNERQVNGNTSYLAAKGKYAPDEVLASCAYDGTLGDGKFTPTVGELATDGSFWKVDLAGLQHLGNDVNRLKNNLFQDETGATNLLIAVLAANDIKNDGTEADKKIYTDALAARILKYDKGMSYYRLNLGVTKDKTTVFGVKRNSIYTVTITKINKLGVNTETGLNLKPELPVTSQDTYVTAVVTVKAWDSVSQEGEL